MSSAIRQNDSSLATPECPAGRAEGGSEDVMTNGLATLRVGDAFVSGAHRDVVAQGCPTAFANRLPLARTGDLLTHGNRIGEGSPDVLVFDGDPADHQCLRTAADSGAPFVGGVKVG